MLQSLPRYSHARGGRPAAHQHTYGFEGESRPVLDMGLRQTINRVLNDKPVSNIIEDRDNPPPADGASSNTVAQLRRIQARVRGRRRQQDYGSASHSNTTDERLDIQSDEEREVGLVSS